MKSISVIIPVYNASTTIIESVESVVTDLLHSDCKWEIILIDDCSTDNSWEIMTKAYGENYKYSNQFTICRLNINGGVAVARNEGLRLAKGDFIAFNDSDDRWLLGKVNLQLSYLNDNPSVGMVSGVFDNDCASVIKKICNESLITIRDQIFKNYFSPQCVMFRRTVLDEVGLFNPKMRYAEEGYFFNKMVVCCNCVLLDVRVTESITSKKRWGDSGLSGNLWKMEKGELYNLFIAYKSRFIPLSYYILSTTFSLFKYIRRVILKQYYKHAK